MNTTRRGFFATLLAALGAGALKLGMKPKPKLHVHYSSEQMLGNAFRPCGKPINFKYGSTRIPTEVSLMKDGSLEVGYSYVDAETVKRILAQNARSRAFQEAKLPNPDGLDGIFSWTPRKS